MMLLLKTFKYAGFLLVLSICSNRVIAQSYQGLEAVKLVNAIDQDSVSIDPKSSGSLIVIIFTSNYCPYSRRYDERILQLHEEFSPRGVQFALVNPNRGPDESLEEMQKMAASIGYTFPYLKDSEQILTGILDASRTPEAFLLKLVNNGFELVYRGALDDNPQTAIDVEKQYLRSAIETMLRGQSVAQDNVKVTGCIIKK